MLNHMNNIPEKGDQARPQARLERRAAHSPEGNMCEPSLRLLGPESLLARTPAELIAALRQLRAEVTAEGEEALERWRRGIARHAFKLSAPNLAHI
jgi:hypothetical protein